MVRYSAGIDIVLLKEVDAQNPFEDKENWTDIPKNVEMAVNKENFKVCLDKLNYQLTKVKNSERLLDLWLSNMKTLPGKSISEALAKVYIQLIFN